MSEHKLGDVSLIRSLVRKNKKLYRLLRKIQFYVRYMAGDQKRKKYYKAVKSFFHNNGNDMLRKCVSLDETSVVFELGGYKGDWIKDMYDQYSCICYAFEPVREFCDIMENRLPKSDKIHIYNVGLGITSYDAAMDIKGDGSAVLEKEKGDGKVKIKSFEEFVKENKINVIDFMQINIEGGEYGLLERIIETGYIKRIKNLQIQFHDKPEIDAERRMFAIQSALEKTHDLVWDFRPYVWERWELKKPFMQDIK